MTEAAGVLSFGLLGDLRAERNDRRLDLGPRLQRHLLAILVVEAGHIVAVDRLIDLLWGETPPAAAIASLQAYVSQLRRILEPDRPARAPARVLVTQDPGYVLRVDADHVDGSRFLYLAVEGRRLLDSGRADEATSYLDQALAIWRGPALVEFESESWAAAAAARLAEARETALEDRIDAWLAGGHHARAVSDIEELVRASPLRERRWAQLILATYRSGRQGDALRAYRRGRTVLADELGVEPGPELRRLESAVLRQDPSLDDVQGKRPTAASPRPILQAQPVADGPLGFHRAQVDRLQARIDSTIHRRGGTVVLVGEPGAGKTTLAEEGAEMASAAGLKVLWSRCLDPGSAPAYWPWLQLLDLLPPDPAGEEARRRLGGQAEAADTGAAAGFRAYQSVLAALRAVSETTALYLVIDDLHSADEASLDLLVLLAGDLDRLPVVVCTTLRDTEPSPALERVVGELLRSRGTERLPVPPLHVEEVARLTQRNTGREPETAVAAALLTRTGGNFFYLVELLRLLGSERGDRALTPADIIGLDVPDDVRDVVSRRVARLPDNSRTVLTVAAVAGSDPDLDVLQRTVDLDSEQLMLALEPAVAAGLLSADESRWGYRFRHPLIQESIYAGIGRVERNRLHVRVAASLEARPNPSGIGRPAQLAHHYLSAGPLGEPDKVVASCRDAARAARQVGAWSEAIRFFREALGAAGRSASPESVGVRCDLLVDLGRVYRAAGRIVESHNSLQEAVDLAEGVDDQERVLSAAVAFSAVSMWGSRPWGQTDHRLVEVLQRQLARLGEAEDGRRVRLLSALASELVFGEGATGGFDYAERALELGRRLGEPGALGVAISSYLLSSRCNDQLAFRLPVIEELLERPAGGVAPDVEFVVRLNLLTEWLRYGELSGFDAEIGRVQELASDVLHSSEMEAQVMIIRACRTSYAQDPSAIREWAERGLQLLDDSSTTWTEPSRFILQSSRLLGSHTLADHAEALEEQALHPNHLSVPHLAFPAAALGYAERGDEDKAREIAEKWFAPPPKSWTALQAIGYWAQVAYLVGEPDPSWLYDQLLPHSGELTLISVGVGCGGAADSLLAGLALRLGRPDEAYARARAGLLLEQRVDARQWLERSAALVEAARSRRSTRRTRQRL